MRNLWYSAFLRYTPVGPFRPDGGDCIRDKTKLVPLSRTVRQGQFYICFAMFALTCRLPPHLSLPQRGKGDREAVDEVFLMPKQLLIRLVPRHLLPQEKAWFARKLYSVRYVRTNL